MWPLQEIGISWTRLERVEFVVWRQVSRQTAMVAPTAGVGAAFAAHQATAMGRTADSSTSAASVSAMASSGDVDSMGLAAHGADVQTAGGVSDMHDAGRHQQQQTATSQPQDPQQQQQTGLTPLRVALRVRPAVVQQDGEGVAARPAPRICVHIVPGEPQVVVGREMDAATNPGGFSNASGSWSATSPNGGVGSAGNGNGGGNASANNGSGSAGASSARKTFTFDHVYGPDSTQQQLYDELAAPLMQQFFNGFNTTILAYGQTLSGKTFTMGSSNGQNTPESVRGIIPRVVHDIFDRIQHHKRFRHRVRVSFLEIYQEQLRDLLVPKGGELREISVRENRQRTISVAGIHEETVTSPAEMMRCLERGGYERTTGDTQMDSHSSRSHAIFTITLEQIDKRVQHMHSGAGGTGAGGHGEVVVPVVLRRSKLHLVDLAGSERLKRTGAESLRLREAVKINTGLLALGNVISVLGADRPSRGPGESPHVPYRDSKLTRLLQDSLGGNSRTIMVACISPLEDDMDETLNTLKYAYRARRIQNKPIVNIVNQQAAEMTSMKLKIDELQGQLQGLSEQPTSPIKVPPQMFDFENEQWVQYFMDELKNRTIRGSNATKALQASNQEKTELEMKLTEITAELGDVIKAHDTAIKQAEDTKVQLEMVQNEVNIVTENAQRLAASLVSNIDQSNEDLCAIVDKYYSGELPASRARIARRESMSRKAIQNERKPLSVEAATEASHGRPHDIGDIDSGAVSASSSLQPLEHELRMSQRRVAELERQLRMLHDFQVTAGTTNADAADLRKSNAELKTENAFLKSELDSHRQTHGATATPASGGSGIMSIKVLNEAASQTDPSLQPVGGTVSRSLSQSNLSPHYQQLDMQSNASETEFPVHVSRDALARLETSRAEDLESPPDAQRLTQELNVAMKAKVDLLRELTKANKESERTRHAHLDIVQRLERELDHTQRELTKAQHEQHERDQAREKLRDEYERKIKVQETHLQKLKTRTKELERGIRDKDHSEKRLQDSQQEMEKMHAQLATWKKKIKEDADKFAEADQRRSREVAALNKQVEDDNKRMRQLDGQLEMARKKLDRRSEEVAALTRKLRDVAMTGGGGGGGPVGSVAGSVKSFRHNHPAAEHVDRANEETSTQISAFEHSTEVLSDTDPAEHDADAAPDASLSLRARSADIERFQVYHKLNKRLREIRAKIDDTEIRINEAAASLDESTDADHREQVSAQLEKLRRDKTVLLRHVVELRTEKRRAEAAMASEQQQQQQRHQAYAHRDGSQRRGRSQSIDEDTIDYSMLIEQFADDPQMIDLIPRLRTATLQECRGVTLECIERIRMLQERLRGTGDYDDLVARLDASASRIASLQAELQRQAKKQDQTIMNKPVDHENHGDKESAHGRPRRAQTADTGAQTDTSTNMPNTGASTSQTATTETIHNLEKDVFYYRNANKELKNKLREVVAVNHRLAKTIQKQKSDTDAAADGNYAGGGESSKGGSVGDSGRRGDGVPYAPAVE